MYGVFWMTPPQSPAAMVATASVSKISRARYSSPTAMADSVLSMPPITVAKANGTARDRYGKAAPMVSAQARVGQGTARARCSGSIVGAGPQPPAARSQKTAAPASTATNAPGMPPGSRTRPTRATSTMVRDTSPTSGSANTLRAGRKAMRRVATPAMEPRSAALGTRRRTQSPGQASTSLRAPMATVTPMPIFHARTGSPVASIAGPRTPKTMPKSDGVSIPKGMAVTSSRPAARASRTASHVYTRSPMSTPAAVPGTMRRRTRSGGNLKTPMRRLPRMTSWVVLSRASPKNALTSPGATQRGPRRATVTLGGSSLARRRRHGVANEPADPLGEGLAPGEAAAAISHFRVGELDLGREPLADPDAQPIGLALARALTIEQHFRMKVLALGMGLREVPDPARHLIVVTAAEHALPLTFVEAAGQTLLATFLVHEGRLPALLAKIADPAAAPFGRFRGRRRGTAADADVLSQRAGEGVRQRAHLGRSEARGLAAADPRELADDLLEPPAGRQRRGQAEHERDEAPEGLGHRHRVRARLADLDEDLEGIAARRLVDGDEGGADGCLHAVGGAGKAVRTRPDHAVIERLRRLRRVATHTHIEHLTSLAAV